MKVRSRAAPGRHQEIPFHTAQQSFQCDLPVGGDAQPFPVIHPRLPRAEKRPRRAVLPGSVTRGIGRSNLVFVATSKPRANYTRFREMTKAIFLVFGKCVREITSREETERPPEESARQIPACSSLPETESLLEIWLGRSNRSRAGLAGSWTTRVQARRAPADPTADRKPKACQ